MSTGGHYTTVGASFQALPTEVILDIIPLIAFSPDVLTSLCLTSQRLKAVVTRHERCLVENIRHLQFSTASLQLFPSFAIDSFRTLRTLYGRLAALEGLHGQWLQITCHSPELDWLSGRWEGIHKAGLLLLYRLQDRHTHDDKVELLNSLPRTSLACLLFKLISSIRILRIRGPAPIHGTFAAGDIMARSDIELAFEEMLLQYGPAFFTAMLRAAEPREKRSEWAIRTLEIEIAGMVERQSPFPDGVAKPATLISCLRRAFAASTGCEINENPNKMWEVLSSTSFDDMTEAKLIQIINGKELTGGMKRIF